MISKKNIYSNIESAKTWIKKRLDRIENIQIKKNILNAIPFWTGAFITGIVSVLYAQLFKWTEMGTVYIFDHIGWLFFILSPLCFYLSWWMVYRYAPYARGSGIPQVTASIQLSVPKYKDKIVKLLSIRVIIVKVCSSLVLLFGGGAIGREGPTIQISASIFKKINDFLPAWYPKVSKKNMIITGAAAGLAAAFNTPLGGVVFAIEELTKTHLNYFKSALLVGVIIAGMTALTILGPYLFLGYPEINDLSIGAISVVIPVAILAGFAGAGMGNTILRIFHWKNKSLKNLPGFVYPVTAGLILAVIAFFIDGRIFGPGKDLMVNTLFSADKHVEWYVPILRLIGPVLSFSNGAAGGIFAPSLSAGASIGSVVSGWLSLNDPESNLLILCGMVACLTGITRSPFTSSILVIEMTNSHNAIFHLMLSALIAYIFTRFMSSSSFYGNLSKYYVKEVKRL